jgi:hypothetical protein
MSWMRCRGPRDNTGTSVDKARRRLAERASAWPAEAWAVMSSNRAARALNVRSVCTAVDHKQQPPSRQPGTKLPTVFAAVLTRGAREARCSHFANKMERVRVQAPGPRGKWSWRHPVRAPCPCAVLTAVSRWARAEHATYRVVASVRTHTPYLTVRQSCSHASSCCVSRGLCGY